MFPYKVGESTSFNDVLKIQLDRKSKYYDKWCNDIQLLDKLRSCIINLETHEHLASSLLKYYTQLSTAAVKFDLSLMSWPWYNAFGKEQKLNIGSLVSYEKSAVLFNLAILYANLGVERIANGKADEEGLKKAAHFFSNSVGVLSFLEAQVKEEGLGAKGSSQLRALSSLMLGMGQECFVLKAIKAGTKDGIIAKLASSASKLFHEAHQICQEESTDFDKDEIAHCFAKAELNKARAQLYKGNDDAANAKYGEQIARFEAALVICKDALASKQAKYMTNHHINDLKSLEALLLASLPKLKKDNELIYMEGVPSKDALMEIQGAQLIKEVPFPTLSDLIGIHGPPLFEKLIPFSIREATEEYGKLKDKRCKELTDRVHDSINLGKAALNALSLPATLEAFEVPLGLPKSILDKSNEVKNEGGTAAILEMQLTLEALVRKDMEILLSARKMIFDEEKEDDELRKRFTSNWRRLPSSKLNQNLKNMIANFQEKMIAASHSDETLAKKLNDSLHVIESICSSKEELEALIPASSASSTVGAKDPNIKLLRQLITQLEAVHKSFQELVAEMKSFCSNDSIENSLMESYSSNGVLITEQIFEKRIAAYNSFMEKIDQTRGIQDSILQKIHETSTKFASISNANRVISEREAAFNNLNSAYSLFMEIKTGLQSGIKFYSDFEPLLLKLETNCSDFVFARNVDKKDHLEGLQLSLSSMNLSNSPTRPQPSAPSIEPGMPILWQQIKIGPRVKEDAWKELVKVLENGSYIDYIQQIDDVWLFVGADEESKDSRRKDSAISIFPRFSLHYALEMIMIHSKSLKNLSLQFHSEFTNQLPWMECLDRISTLDLRMRVNSSLCASIFSSITNSLTCLNLSWAEIPDSSLQLIGHSCPALTIITIHITDLDSRSRFHLRYEPGTSDLITNTGFAAIISGCTKLRVLNIFPLIQISNISEISKLKHLKEVSITLNAEKGITFSAIHKLLITMPHISIAHIISGSKNDLESRVIDEGQLFSILESGYLKRLRLLNMDFCRKIQGFPSYYGGASNPWMIADLKERLSRCFPLLEVLIEFTN